MRVYLEELHVSNGVREFLHHFLHLAVGEARVGRGLDGIRRGSGAAARGWSRGVCMSSGFSASSFLCGDLLTMSPMGHVCIVLVDVQNSATKFSLKNFDGLCIIVRLFAPDI